MQAWRTCLSGPPSAPATAAWCGGSRGHWRRWRRCTPCGPSTRPTSQVSRGCQLAQQPACALPQAKSTLATTGALQLRQWCAKRAPTPAACRAAGPPAAAECPLGSLGLPPSVHVLPWVPQTDLLAHPATKVFVSHAGLNRREGRCRRSARRLSGVQRAERCRPCPLPAPLATHCDAARPCLQRVRVSLEWQAYGVPAADS